MKIYNLGSINWDHCYRLTHFVRPGETLTSSAYQRNLGGKGANQSAAAARAGATVRHIGAIGLGDSSILSLMKEIGIDTGGINELAVDATGHAIIQINQDGENAIILHPGTNRALSADWIDRQLATAVSGDWLLMQNETNLIRETAALARKRGLKVAFNPAPMDKDLTLALLEKLDLLIVNEVELQDLTGTDELETALVQIRQQAPELAVLVTLGAKGACYQDPQQREQVSACPVQAVDTTAAGDTFIGFFLASRVQGAAISDSLKLAGAAAALCVSRPGAIPAIPTRQEAEQFLLGQAG
ncbi:ribokinase [Bowmanella dokdonensis]|uniref:Ribokinase n=1 Tax=Bowmanella dokdonensis TaxID=751969 RepID=A0A939IRE8_9ALTE|nr:ribokinase [Bowmanella dokdonensis]MBN7826034.1 ribokinase [Bowmanella dokdonensis]